jgi:hypothetical protein
MSIFNCILIDNIINEYRLIFLVDNHVEKNIRRTYSQKISSTRNKTLQQLIGCDKHTLISHLRSFLNVYYPNNKAWVKYCRPNNFNDMHWNLHYPSMEDNYPIDLKQQLFNYKYIYPCLQNSKYTIINKNADTETWDIVTKYYKNNIDNIPMIDLTKK